MAEIKPKPVVVPEREQRGLQPPCRGTVSHALVTIQVELNFIQI